MDITAFIRELLFGHDCVIVPGFGGFIGNYSPARVDKTTGTFYPPVKQLSFNRNLNHNDGLLIKKVSGATGLNYGDARNIVTEFVSETRTRIGKGERITFDRIGTFYANHEGSLQFEPDSTVNYHPDSFGLEPFRCMPLEGYDVRKRIVAADRGDSAKFRKYLWRAAVMIPVAVALIAVPLKTDLLKSRVEASTMNPLVNAELEHNKAAVEDLIVSVPAPATTKTTTTTEPVASEPEQVVSVSSSDPVKEITAGSIASVTRYYIITGSFQSEENAGKQVKQLQQEGFNPEVIEGANGYFRVCAIACPDLETAIEKKDSILSKFPGSWISRKR